MGKRNLLGDTHADYIIEEYGAGKSELALSKELGFSRQVIRKRLEEAGIEPRGRSAAMFVRMAKTTFDERRALSAAANMARRGSTPSDTEMCRRARTRQDDLSMVGKFEIEILKLLRAQGFDPVPQLAVDRYNIDIAVSPIAIEVHHHTANPISASNLRERIEYLREGRWFVVYLWIPPPRDLLTKRARKDLVTLVKRAHRDESFRGQYRMIRSPRKALS